jgi:hypothetical protein
VASERTEWACCRAYRLYGAPRFVVLYEMFIWELTVRDAVIKRLTLAVVDTFIADLKASVEEAKMAPSGKGTMVALYGMSSASTFPRGFFLGGYLYFLFIRAVRDFFFLCFGSSVSIHYRPTVFLRVVSSSSFYILLVRRSVELTPLVLSFSSPPPYFALLPISTH